MNRLLFGDNLKWLCDTKRFADGSIDLVYLDPPQLQRQCRRTRRERGGRVIETLKKLLKNRR